MSKTKKIAITGSIGSGKSAVITYLKERGYCVFSADEYVKKLYQTDYELINQINTLSSIDLIKKGQLDIEALRKIVFEDIDFKKKLEEIVHQKVREEIQKPISSICFYEIPLLYESCMDRLFNEVIVVVVSPELQQKRLQEYRKMTPVSIAKRLKTQMNQSDKIKKADVIFINSGSLSELHDQVELYLERRGLNDIRPNES